MSQWLGDGLVLEGEGSGEAVPSSPRQRTLPPGSPMPGRARSPLASPSSRESGLGSPQAETMGKARELFVLCDKEGKGFITKRDMQRLQGELPLSPEQLEEVFESLDRQSNGFLTPAEFNTGLGEMVGPDEATELDGSEEENRAAANEAQDPAALWLMDVLTELGADKVFKDREQFCSLWYQLQKDKPELLGSLENILVHAVSHLQDSTRERDSLEVALRRRENEHDQVVCSIYEEMESQVREERDKRQSQESVRQKQIGKLEEELKLREQELENLQSRQRELDSRVQQLSSEQADIRLQNQQLRSLNTQLQQQLEGGREQLQATLAQLRLLEHNAAQEQHDRQRNVLRVSRNIQKEKESLVRQLDLLRDMNRRLRDEKDAQQSQRRVSHSRHSVLPSLPLNYYLREDLSTPWTRKIFPT